MTKEETRGLLIYLEQFWPNKRFKNPAAMLAAWADALAPFEYSEVKAAAARYATKNKFYPDLADLTTGLSPKAQPESEQMNNSPIGSSQSETERIKAMMEKL